MLFIITSLTDLVSVTLFFVVGHTLFPAGLGYKYSSDNNFISYWLPFGYTELILLASRPDGTHKFVSPVRCVYGVNRVVSSCFFVHGHYKIFLTLQRYKNKEQL